MADYLSPELQKLKSALEDQGVRYALASFVDIHGISKAKAVPLAQLSAMMDGSELFTGAALDGVPQSVHDEEVSALPDVDSVTVLPWNPKFAWFASDLYLKGELFEASSRAILKRVLAQCEDLGFTFNLGIKTEFYILKETEDGQIVSAGDRPALDKPCYDLSALLDNAPWMAELVDGLNHLGWQVSSFNQEDGHGQLKVDFPGVYALKMGDRFTFFRLMVREIARKHGYFATFMPKPFGDRTGNGAHYQMTLLDARTGENRFVDGNDPRGCKLSRLGYQFIAGILKHAPAICAVIAPTVNSYKRLVKQGNQSGLTWAPVHVSYGNNNRTNLLRIPKNGGRVECRAADMACNPYLGAAMLLAAGLEGIREELDPGEPHTENMYTYSLIELSQKGISFLPRNLGEAITAFATDLLSESVMGPLMYETFIKLKSQEWQDYHSHVSDWETRRYLKFF